MWQVDQSHGITTIEKSHYYMQTRKQSLLESTTNIISGFIIALLASFIIFPLCGIDTKFGQNIGSMLMFTVLSFSRQYVIRRIFNHKQKNKHK